MVQPSLAEGFSEHWRRTVDRCRCGPGPPNDYDTGSEGDWGESSLMTLRPVMGESHAFLRTRTDLS